MDKGKVLFLYPNSEGYGGVPNGIALLSACLNQAGFTTDCFDTTFLYSPPLSHIQRAKHGGALDVDYKNVWGEWDPALAKKVPELFIQEVERFNPDLIAVSNADVNVCLAADLIKHIKEKFDIPVIAGGIACTTSPELVIQNKSIDMVCVGEGEEAIVELCEAIVNKQDYTYIQNLWVKKDGAIIKNSLRPLFNMDKLPFQDWSIFDKRHYYKAYCGKYRRTGFFELARGCHFNCTYCATAALRKMYKGLGSFVRHRDIDKTLDEICYIDERYQLELVFFIDDDFLGMSKERFDYFCKEYKRRVNLPFWIQTRSETVKDMYLKRLKEINVSTVSIGVEHGDEDFRKEYMNRRMTNKSLQNAFDLVHKYNIRSTANIIIGMPNETEEMFKKNIALLKSLKPKSISVNFYQPFRGTAMRQMAVDKGIIESDHIVKESNTCLDVPGFKKERIMHYYENLKKYIDGELEI